MMMQTETGFLTMKILYPWVSVLCIPALAINAALARDEKDSLQEQEQVSQEQIVQEDARIERVQVIGRRWLPEHVSAEGGFTLNREFLDNALKGNGNVTDMLLFLPGVQGSESALDVSQQAEIKSQLISISGAQPWQTSFVLDGMSNNSYLDPGSATRSVNAINDVQGHPEATFVNHELIGSVTVYDSNVPARFGEFGGGVVDMELRDASNTPRITLDYRRSNSSWGSYHFIDNREYNEDAEEAATEVDWPSAPNFDKESISFSVSQTLSARQSLMISAARTTSKITDISLQQPVQTERESISTSVTYSLNNVLLDSIRLTAGYSPYTGSHLISDVKDSEFSLKGGGRRLSASFAHAVLGGDWRASLGWSESDNSRTAPNVFLPWYRAAGKDWGIDSGSPPFSIEGGYGDLDKTQTTWTANTSFTRDLGIAFGADHRLDIGGSWRYMRLQRQRPDTSAIYSSAWRDSNIQCGGVTLDCIEQSYQIPLSELAGQLGGQIDFTNPDHVRAYQDNMLSRGQYFRYRRLYLAEDIDVSLYQADMYAEHNMRWDNLDLTWGGRLDYDDFLQNLNASYRSRASYDLFGWNRTFLTAGANRYYSANLLTYRIREAQRPYITQYRPISQGEVAGWITSSTAERFRYRFDDVRTPYGDELTLGIRQRIWQNGMLSLRWVKRWGYDQLTRGPQEYMDGYTYLYQTNEGRTQHERVSLSYSHAWQNHALTWNLNYTDNKSNASSYDGTVDGVPEDELVFLRREIEGAEPTYQLMSYDDLNRRQSDFSRPITTNLVWNAAWHDSLSTTLTMSYVGKFDSVSDTGLYREAERGDEVCSDCDISNLTYPVFSEFERPSRIMFNGRVQYTVPVSGNHTLSLSTEISNLFNQRTYIIGPSSRGIEVGREFWLGLNYRWY